MQGLLALPPVRVLTPLQVPPLLLLLSVLPSVLLLPAMLLLLPLVPPLPWAPRLVRPLHQWRQQVQQQALASYCPWARSSSSAWPC